jgi:hypothetical protein
MSVFGSAVLRNTRQVPVKTIIPNPQIIPLFDKLIHFLYITFCFNNWYFKSGHLSCARGQTEYAYDISVWIEFTRWLGAGAVHHV